MRRKQKAARRRRGGAAASTAAAASAAQEGAGGPGPLKPLRAEKRRARGARCAAAARDDGAGPAVVPRRKTCRLRRGPAGRAPYKAAATAPRRRLFVNPTAAARRPGRRVGRWRAAAAVQAAEEPRRAALADLRAQPPAPDLRGLGEATARDDDASDDAMFRRPVSIIRRGPRPQPAGSRDFPGATARRCMEARPRRRRCRFPRAPAR